MKLSELSYREYLAIEVFPRFVGSMPDSEAAWRAFGAADAFLKRAGTEQDKITAAEKRAAEAEQALEVMRDYIFLDINGTTLSDRVALTSIWDMLGVSNQTAAMQKLRELLP